MTKEEAISILNNAAWLGDNQQRERVEEAVQIVNALGVLIDPDFVKVVRCKDCDRARVEYNTSGDPVYICEMYKPMRIHATTDGKAFCSNGRQK